jgi:nucleoside-diphosphate-sugar epimerase
VSGHALVTGATGFLGTHLVKRLVRDGWMVSALQRSETAGSDAATNLAARGVNVLAFRTGADVQEQAGAASPDVVFHLATHYLKDHTPADVPLLLDANIALGTHLLEGLRGVDAPVVSALSYFQFCEGVPRPVSLYSATKQAYFDVSEYYRIVAGMGIVQVILYDTYGPDDTRDKLVPHLMRSVREGRAMRLGPSAQQINLLYVDDVIEGLLAAAQNVADPLVALRAPAAVSVGQLVAALAAVSGREVMATFDDARPVSTGVSDAGEWPAPRSWAPAIDLADGLARTWRSLAAPAAANDP